VDPIIIVAIVVIIALIFEYSNGFNDAANALATTVSTRALEPKNALLLGVIFEFMGAFIVINLTMLLGNILFFKPVADTMGKIVSLPAVGSEISNGEIFSLEYLGLIICIGLITAFIWNLGARHLGVPTSSSHAMIGGICGAGFAAFGIGAIKIEIVMLAFLSLVISPLIAIPIAYVLMKFIFYIVRNSNLSVKEKFRKGVIISSAAFAFSHGANDGQKTMGIISLFLLSAGMLQLSPSGIIYPPLWVILLCSLAMAFGIATGAWKIIKTVGTKIFKMRYEHGFNAQTSATAIILVGSFIGLPVSTTHVMTASIMGTGAAQRIKAVKWGIGKTLLTAWILTIPITFIISAVIYTIFALIFHTPKIF